MGAGQCAAVALHRRGESRADGSPGREPAVAPAAQDSGAAGGVRPSPPEASAGSRSGSAWAAAGAGPIRTATTRIFGPARARNSGSNCCSLMRLASSVPRENSTMLPVSSRPSWFCSFCLAANAVSYSAVRDPCPGAASSARAPSARDSRVASSSGRKRQPGVPARPRHRPQSKPRLPAGLRAQGGACRAAARAARAGHGHLTRHCRQPAGSLNNRLAPRSLVLTGAALVAAAAIRTFIAIRRPLRTGDVRRRTAGATSPAR